MRREKYSTVNFMLFTLLIWIVHHRSTLILVNGQNFDDVNDDIADFEFETSSKNINDDGSLNIKSRNSNNHKFINYGDDGIYDDVKDHYSNINEFFSNFNNGNNDNKEQSKNEPNVFDAKEKAIRIALSKALTNKMMRQKFVEVIPILRVLSSEQRLALSALISAQINAKPGTELKLDQVKNMFGDSRKLIIPIVFDIANLVRTAAKYSLHNPYDIHSDKSHVSQKLHESKRKPQKQQQQKQQQNQQQHQQQQQITRRNFDEITDNADDYMPDEIIDAKRINDELYYATRKGRLIKLVSKHQLNDYENNEQKNDRLKRSLSPLTEHTKFISQQDHHLVNGDRTFHRRKLNISNFENNEDRLLIEPLEIFSRNSLNSSYHTIEDQAFADINGTEIPNTTDDNTFIEELPIPESLISPSRYRQKNNNKLSNNSRKSTVNQQRISSGGRTRKPIITNTNHSNYSGSKCERFTPSVCIHADDYPTEQIMGSIRRHKHAMSALLAEYRDKTTDIDYQDYLNNLDLNKKRREDSSSGSTGGMCSSIVRYARPQKARSATGEWKYIVNTGQHTQTLRLEKCSNPQNSCSYLSENYRSRCLQVYNYHRLLSWDKTRGLHIDIFKVPTCCSCHVDGFREAFPPLQNSHPFIANFNDFSSSSIFKHNPYSTITEEENETPEEDEDSEEESVAYQFANGFKRVNPNKYEPTNELYQTSSNLKNRLDQPKTLKITPTLGSFLSPPIGDYDVQLNFKRGPNLTVNKNSSSRKRRPSPPSTNNYAESDDRSDQIISESDIGKEVTVFPTSQKSTTRPKRIKYINNSVSTSAPTKSFTAFSSTPSTTTFSTKTPSNTKKLLNTKLTNTKGEMSRRINYNYHPIIDFFEEHLPLTTSSSSSLSSLGKRGKKDAHDNFGSMSDWRPVIIN